MKKTTLKHLQLIFWFIPFMIPVSASAVEGYQYSVAAIYQNMENDSDFESTLMIGGLAYYFEPVPSRSGPFAEVDFLNRQTHIIGAFGLVEYDFGGADVDGNAYLVGFTYADPSNPVTLGVTYTNIDADDTVIGSSVNIEGDELALNLGYYLNDRSMVSFYVAQSDSEITVNGTVIGESETDAMGLTYRILESLEGNKFVGVQLGYERYDNIDDETNSEIMISAAYYFDQKVGVYGGYTINSGDDSTDEGKTIKLGLSVYMSQTSGVKLDIEKFSADEDGYDEDTVSFEFTHRFN